MVSNGHLRTGKVMWIGGQHIHNRVFIHPVNVACWKVGHCPPQPLFRFLVAIDLGLARNDSRRRD